MIHHIYQNEEKKRCHEKEFRAFNVEGTLYVEFKHYALIVELLGFKRYIKLFASLNKSILVN